MSLRGQSRSPRRDIQKKSSAVAEMGDRGHNRHGPKRWGLLCPFRAELGPRLIQCGLGRGLLPHQVASSSIQSFGHNGHWTKIGGLCPFRGGKAASPSNTKSPGLRPTSIPSGILMHPAVWRHGPKIRGVCPIFGGRELRPHLVQCGLDQGPPPCQLPS